MPADGPCLLFAACRGRPAGERLFQHDQYLQIFPPNFNGFFDNSYGYAVFPVVGKAALIVGGGYGQGQVYRSGRASPVQRSSSRPPSVSSGEDRLSAKSFSSAINGRTIFSPAGDFAFDANASAVVVTVGAQAKASTTGIFGQCHGRPSDRSTVTVLLCLQRHGDVRLHPGRSDGGTGPQRTEVYLSSILGPVVAIQVSAAPSPAC